MKFEYPGSDVALCTSIWILLGAVSVWMGIQMGHLPWYMILAAHVAILAIGMWFRIRFAGYAFGTVNLLLALMGIVAVIALPGSRSLKVCSRIIGNLYAGWIAIEWANHLGDNDVMNEVSETEPTDDSDDDLDEFHDPHANSNPYADR